MCGSMFDYRKGCRCPLCRASNAERVRRNRANRRIEQRLSHGTRSAYDAGCRCSECKWARRYVYERDEGRRPHRWRSFIMEHFGMAQEAWWHAMEDATAMRATEVAEYVALNPQPRLKDFLTFNRRRR